MTIVPATWVFGNGNGGSEVIAVLRILVSYEEAEVEEMPWVDIGSFVGFSKGKKP